MTVCGAMFNMTIGQRQFRWLTSVPPRALLSTENKRCWPSRMALSPSFTENNTHNLTPATFDTQKLLFTWKVHYPAADILNISGMFASLEEKGSQTAITVNEGFCLDWISSVGHKSCTIKIDLYSW